MTVGAFLDALARGADRPGDVETVSAAPMDRLAHLLEHVTDARLARAAAVLGVHVDLDDAPAFAQEVAELVRIARGPADRDARLNSIRESLPLVLTAVLASPEPPSAGFDVDEVLARLPLQALAGDAGRRSPKGLRVKVANGGHWAGVCCQSLGVIMIDRAALAAGDAAAARVWAHELAHFLDPDPDAPMEGKEFFADHLGAALLAVEPTTVADAAPLIEISLRAARWLRRDAPTDVGALVRAAAHNIVPRQTEALVGADNAVRSKDLNP